MTPVSWRAGACLAIALLVAPVAVDLAASGQRGAVRYVAADTFYYLTVARNIALAGEVSFDQDRPTNGFHPLWQGASAAVYGGARALGIDDNGVLTVVVVLNLLLLAVTVYWLAIAMRDRDRLSPLFGLLPVGVVGLLIAPMWIALGRAGVAAESLAEGGRPLYATLWSYANGMESSTVLVLYAAIAVLFVRRPHALSLWGAIGWGVLLAMFALSRLDHGALSVAIAIWFFVSARRRADSMVPPIVAAATLAAVLGLMLAINWIGFGSLLPVSARIKTTFPGVSVYNFEALGHIARGEWPGLPIAVRVAQIVIPGLASVIVLIVSWWRGIEPEPADRFLVLTAFAVLALALYNLLFVDLWAQGHWYFPMSSVWLSLIAIRAIGRKRAPAAVAWTVQAVPVAAVVVAVFVGLFRDPAYHRDMTAFLYDEAPRVRAHYAKESPRVIDYDDGIIAYATGYPALSGLGYLLDAKALRYFEQKRLLEIALERRFDRVSAVQYLRPSQPVPPVGSSAEESSELRGWLERRFGAEALVANEFVIDYRSEDGRFVFIRVVP